MTLRYMCLYLKAGLLFVLLPLSTLSAQTPQVRSAIEFSCVSWEQISISEIFYRTYHRVRSGRSKPAQTGLFDQARQFFERFDVAFFTFAIAKPFQYLQHPPGTDPAKRALTAGLVLRKLQKVPCDIDHAVGLV